MNAQTLECPEPGCGGRLELKPSRYGLFYGCENWKRTGCKGSHGAHPDGRPLGTPASQATKLARIRAHDLFDRLWKNASSKRRKNRRTNAYKRLAEAMGLTVDECHFGSFSIVQCDRAAAIVHAWLDQRHHQRDVERARHG